MYLYNIESTTYKQRETPHMALVESADGPSDVDSDYDSDFDEEEYASHNGVEQEGVEMTVAPPQQEEGRPSNHQDQRPPQPPQTLSSPPPMTPAFLLLEPSGLSLASAAAIRTESVPPHRVHPHPRHAPAHRRMLPWWYALRVKRLRELRELFHGTTGTALTLLGTTLPFMWVDIVGGFGGGGRTGRGDRDASVRGA